MSTSWMSILRNDENADGGAGTPIPAPSCAPADASPDRPPPAGSGNPPTRRGTRGRRLRGLAVLGALLVATPLVAVFVPLGPVDRLVAALLADRVRDQLHCTAGVVPEVSVEGSGLLRQALAGHLDEVRLAIPRTSLGRVHGLRITATVHDLSQSGTGARLGRVDATIGVPFSALPSSAGGSPVTFSATGDGALDVNVLRSRTGIGHVRATVYLKLALAGASVRLLPQRLFIFGRSIPAERVTALTGGGRTVPLPTLPDGVDYTSIVPQRDGLHVGLAGAVVTPLSDLPTHVGGHTVTYAAQDGLLGISTTLDVAGLAGVPITVNVQPQVQGRTLVLVPRSVDVLGAERAPDDPLAALVLNQIRQDDLRRRLPALPDGVRYRSVGVSSAGVAVSIAGITVRSYAELPVPPDLPPVALGAEHGLLTVTTRGSAARGSARSGSARSDSARSGSARSGSAAAFPVVLRARPRIAGNTLDLNPREIEMFGVMFPARQVLDRVGSPTTSFRLTTLPAGMHYGSVEVLPGRLRLHLSGRDVTVGRPGAPRLALC